MNQPTDSPAHLYLRLFSFSYNFQEAPFFLLFFVCERVCRSVGINAIIRPIMDHLNCNIFLMNGQMEEGYLWHDRVLKGLISFNMALN